MQKMKSETKAADTLGKLFLVRIVCRVKIVKCLLKLVSTDGAIRGLWPLGQISILYQSSDIISPDICSKTANNCKYLSEF